MKPMQTRLTVATLLAIAIVLGVMIKLELNTMAQTSAPSAALFDGSDPAVAAKLTALGKRNIRVHDPSTFIKCKDEYWFFFTGSGVQSFHSKDLVNWQAGPRIHNSTPEWVAAVVPPRQGRRGGGGGGAQASSTAPSPATTPTTRRGGGGVMGFWAPDVIFINNQYHVYYSASAFGVNTSGIGLVTNPTLDPNDPAYKWTDQGLVISSKTGDNFNTIDPALIQTPEGELWMSFGSFWSGIKLIQLDPKTGKRIAPDSPIHSIAYKREIEAPFIYHHDGNYYLFVSWGFCCRGVNSTYNIRVGRSKSITGPYLDKEGKDLAKEGGTLLAGSDGPFIGPGHPGILKEGDKYIFSMHFYDGTDRRGAGTLAVRNLKWDADGWPALE